MNKIKYKIQSKQFHFECFDCMIAYNTDEVEVGETQLASVCPKCGKIVLAKKPEYLTEMARECSECKEDECGIECLRKESKTYVKDDGKTIEQHLKL